MRLLKSRDLGLLACFALIVILFGAAVDTVNHDTNPEPAYREKHEESYEIEIKKERGFNETLAADPIALYTERLFWATFFLALFTIILAFVTILIWLDAKETSKRQRLVSKRTLIHAARGTRTAELGLENARNVGKQQLRAYISFLLIEIRQSADFQEHVLGYGMMAHWKNAGQTPAVNARSVCNKTFVFEGDEAIFEARADVVPAVIGSVGPGLEKICGVVNFSVSEVIGQRAGHFRIAVLFSFIYDDIFGQTHTEHACSEIIFVGFDPRKRMLVPDTSENPFLMRELHFRVVNSFN